MNRTSDQSSATPQQENNDQQQQQQQQEQQPQPRRGKMSKRACDSCNVRKIFCDGRQPCESCIRARINCTFLKQHLRPGPRKPRLKTFQLINSSQHDWKLGHGRGRKKRRRSGASTDDDSASNSTPGDSASVAKGKASPYAAIPDNNNNNNNNRSSDSKKCRLPINVLLYYIEIYSHRLYPVWPVLSGDDLKTRLRDENDLEAYSLAAAVSAAVIGQLRLECVFNMEDGSGPINGAALATESIRLRSTYAYREKFTAEEIMTSFFLHVHYVNRPGKSKSGLLFLREAIAFAQAMRLDREATYSDQKNFGDSESRRKLYWLLLISDITYAMQHGFQTTLNMEINPPTLTSESEPMLCGFINLISLFQRLYSHKCVIDSWISQEKTLCSEDSLRRLQTELSENFPYELPANETQKADILATRSWMRVVAWNVSMRHGFLSSDSNDAAMALNYPAAIAEDLLEAFAMLPRSAIEVHGNVMELKLFEITNSLGDLLIHAPLLFEHSTWKSGPREYFLQLVDHMIQFRNINQSILSIILEKGEKIGVPLPPPTRRLSADDSDGSRSEYQFTGIHGVTEEATRNYRAAARSSRTSNGPQRSSVIRHNSVESSDGTTDTNSSERVMYTTRRSPHFDEEYTMMSTTAPSTLPICTTCCSPPGNPAMVGAYFDPFAITPITPTTQGPPHIS